MNRAIGYTMWRARSAVGYGQSICLASGIIGGGAGADRLCDNMVVVDETWDRAIIPI